MYDATQIVHADRQSGLFHARLTPHKIDSLVGASGSNATRSTCVGLVTFSGATVVKTVHPLADAEGNTCSH